MTDDEKICSLIERETGEKITRDTPLDSLDLDSLEFAHLVLKAGGELGRDIAIEKAVEAKTVGDLACL